jgi:hypothetical protein
MSAPSLAEEIHLTGMSCERELQWHWYASVREANGIAYHLTFAQKQGGSKLGKLVPKWHTAWDWKALRREVCHHDNAVGSIDDETLHIVCSVSGLGIRLAPIGFLRPVA